MNPSHTHTPGPDPPGRHTHCDTSGSPNAPARTAGTVRAAFFAFLFVAIVIPLGSCHQPVPPPAAPIPVRVVDLVAAYRNERRRADEAFTGQPVRVLVVTCRADGSALVCHDLAARPPVLVLEFDRPPDARVPCWVTGTCRGVQPAGWVLVTGCRIAGPPSRPGP